VAIAAAGNSAAPPKAVEKPPPPAPSGSIRIVSCRTGAASEQSTTDGLEGLVAQRETVVWVDLVDPEPSVVEDVASKLGLHPLVAEDIIESNERAKIEPIGEHLHIVMFVVSRDAETDAREVDFVLGENFLLSVHPEGWDPRRAHQLKLGLGIVLDRGPDFLLWALVDSIVDGYFPVFDTIADEIDELEDQVISNTSSDTLRRLSRLKRELISLRHVIAPSREIFAQLTGREFDLIGEQTVFYFRDVYDHLIRLTDEFDTFRDLVTGALELYLSTVNNNLSAIMKRLTGVTVLLAGIGAVAGIFGMSEASASLAGKEGPGFYVITAMTIVAAAAAAWFLHRIDWL
jgi:magnesium transporter